MRRLNEAGVDSPRRDCLVLVEDLLKKDRSWVNAHADFKLANGQVKVLDKQIDRRVKHEPLAYIRTKAWFYKRFFKVTPDVMIPRPESESMIEIIKDMNSPRIIDIGTGSGCLAITAKLELPDSEVTAIDIDEKALNLAKVNAKEHNAEVSFIKGSLISPMSDENLSDSAVLANLPYVPEGFITSEEINYEPKTALFSGRDGLDHYRSFWQEIGSLKIKPGVILVESLENQHKTMKELADNAGYKLVGSRILIQIFKPA
jgi:release factor glutamine methyltransferase